MIHLARTGAVWYGSEDAVSSLREEFERRQCVRLRVLIDGETAQRLTREIDGSDFIERVHNDAGDPPPVDLCMQNHRVLAWLNFLANDPLLLSIVQQITGCGPLG